MTEAPDALPRLPHERTFERLRLAIIESFADDELLANVTVMPVWKIVSGDLPVGMTVGRQGPVLALGDMMEVLQQLVKLLQHKSAAIMNFLQAADETAGQLAKLIHGYETRLAELRALQSGDVPTIAEPPHDRSGRPAAPG